MRPTGPLHIGHVHGVLDTWASMQDDYDCFFFVADYHALTTFSPEMNVGANTLEVMLDWLSCGLDPVRSTYSASRILSKSRRFICFYRCSRRSGGFSEIRHTKEQVERLGLESPSYGLLGYPVLQSADILLYRGELVPIGKDQAPHLNLTVDLAEAMVEKFGPIFPVPGYMHSEYATVPGTDNRKMSKSYGNAIYLRESEEETTKKVMTMYTDPLKPYKNDPGHPADCPVYYMFKIYIKDAAALDEIRAKCESGERGGPDASASLRRK